MSVKTCTIRSRAQTILMRDARSHTALVCPQVKWAIPEAAYRLLLEFLKCESSFCNLVVPRFHPFGWVSLRGNEKPEEG